MIRHICPHSDTGLWQRVHGRAIAVASFLPQVPGLTWYDRHLIYHRNTENLPLSFLIHRLPILWVTSDRAGLLYPSLQQEGWLLQECSGRGTHIFLKNSQEMLKAVPFARLTLVNTLSPTRSLRPGVDTSREMTNGKAGETNQQQLGRFEVREFRYDKSQDQYPS